MVLITDSLDICECLVVILLVLIFSHPLVSLFPSTPCQCSENSVTNIDSVIFASTFAFVKTNNGSSGALQE